MTSSSDLPVYAGGPVQSGGDRGHRGDRATVVPWYRSTGQPIPGNRFRATDSEEKYSDPKPARSRLQRPYYGGIVCGRDPKTGSGNMGGRPTRVTDPGHHRVTEPCHHRVTDPGHRRAKKK